MTLCAAWSRQRRRRLTGYWYESFRSYQRAVAYSFSEYCDNTIPDSGLEDGVESLLDHLLLLHRFYHPLNGLVCRILNILLPLHSSDQSGKGDTSSIWVGL